MWLLFFLVCVVVNEKYVKSSACLSPHGLHNDRLELKVLNAWTCRLGVSLLAVTSGRLFCLGCLGLLGGILSRLQALLELLWHGLQLTRGLAHAPRQAHKLVRALSSTRGKQQIQWHISHSQIPSLLKLQLTVMYVSYQDNSGHHGNHDKLGRPEPENAI